MTFGSLFAGVGGFDLGLERAGFRCDWQVEIDPFARRVLEEHWPHVRRHDDVRTFPPTEAEDWRVDLVCGGFPCQDISSSGKRAGLDGARSGLWREFARVVGLLRPRYVVVENVSDLVHRGLGAVLGGLAEVGYDAEWHCLSAADLGAPQGRDRIWIVAYPHGGGREGVAERHRQGPILGRRPDDDGLALAQRRAREAPSRVRRMDDGLPRGLDRLRALGNAVHPACAEWIGRAILASDLGEAT